MSDEKTKTLGQVNRARILLGAAHDTVVRIDNANMERLLNTIDAADTILADLVKTIEAVQGADDSGKDRLAKVKQLHARAYEKWTHEEDADLLSLFATGMPLAKLAAHFQRQPSAIRSRLEKLSPAPDLAVDGYKIPITLASDSATEIERPRPAKLFDKLRRVFFRALHSHHHAAISPSPVLPRPQEPERKEGAGAVPTAKTPARATADTSETKIGFCSDRKFDIQLSEALIHERRLGAIFENGKIEKIELKTETWQWEKTGNICIEYRQNGNPSGIAATEADLWVHELKRDGETLCYLMFPAERLKKLAREAFKKGRCRSNAGDGGRFDVVLLRLRDILK